MTLADLAIALGVLMFGACGVVILLWTLDPLRGPDDEERL